MEGLHGGPGDPLSLSCSAAQPAVLPGPCLGGCWGQLRPLCLLLALHGCSLMSVGKGRTQRGKGGSGFQSPRSFPKITKSEDPQPR